MRGVTLRSQIKKVSFQSWLFGCLVALLVVSMCNSVLIDRNTDFREQWVLTAENCCNGFYCTDTYYDVDRDICVLTLSGETYEANNTPLVSVLI